MSKVLVDPNDLVLVLDESLAELPEVAGARFRLLRAVAETPRSIEVYFDPAGMRDGQTGCYRARIVDFHGCHDAGDTPKRAVDRLMRLAPSHGCSGDIDDYRVVLL